MVWVWLVRGRCCKASDFRNPGMACGDWEASRSLWLCSPAWGVVVESLESLLAVGVLEGLVDLLAAGVSGAGLCPKRCSDSVSVMSLGRP